MPGRTFLRGGQRMSARELQRERSRRALASSLLGLLSRRRLSELSVSDLVGEAGVARATFYRNFASVEDVAEYCADALWREIVPAVSGPFAEEGELAALLERCREHATELLALYDGGFAPRLQRRVEGSLSEGLAVIAGDRADVYLSCFLAAGVTNVVMRWLRGGAREPALLVARELRAFAEGAVAAARRPRC